MKTLATYALYQIDLTRQKITKQMDSKLELRDNSVRILYKFLAREPKADVTPEELAYQDNTEWGEVYNYADITVRRARISGAEMTYLSEMGIWKVTIFVNGFPEDIRIYFDKKTEAKVINDRINEYLYGKEGENLEAE